VKFTKRTQFEKFVITSKPMRNLIPPSHFDPKNEPNLRQNQALRFQFLRTFACRGASTGGMMVKEGIKLKSNRNQAELILGMRRIISPNPILAVWRVA
jgi:hypothetical protein